MQCNRFGSVDHPPFVEIALWAQTRQRWIADTNFNTLKGCEYFGFERWQFIPINLAMLPAFEHRVIEENERIVLYRGSDGILHRALKEGQVG